MLDETKDNIMRDVVLTACNERDLYLKRKYAQIIIILDNWIRGYTSKLSSLDSAKCIVEILEYWNLDNND